MPADQSVMLAEFARACRTATRSVSLYPATHPSIQASLSRVIAAANRLVPAGDVVLNVHPDTLTIDGRAPERPDNAIVELAGLMHDRLVGALRVERGADALDWHALLLLLARPPEELIAEGGIAKMWTAAGRSHFEIREIDYAEVLRERGGGGGGPEWDAIINFCLQGGSGPLDEQGLTMLLETMGDSSKFGELLDRLQSAETGGDATVTTRAAALITLLQKMLEATAQGRASQSEDVVMQTAADALSRLTPEMVLAVIQHTRSQDQEQAQMASDLVNRVTDETIATFVADSVVKTRGASERLAQAFEALVPEVDRKERLLSLAKDEAAQGPFGAEASFEDVWSSATQMLTSYTDEQYVSTAYARELSGARKQAIDVERVSDDPPERIQAWLSTISDESVKDLDFHLLLDLLMVESNPSLWTETARLVVAQIDRRIQAGDVENAHTFIQALVRETGAEGRESLRSAAGTVVDTLAGGSFGRHLVHRLRKAADEEVEPLNGLCHMIGTRMIKPLAEALMVEEDDRAIRRLRELLFGFGAAGRESVERLKLSPNPAIRRAAIELLRMFGGQEALADLSTMLEDQDPQVQREAIRAIVHTGLPEGFAILQRALLGAGNRATLLEELMSLRDDRVVPLLCAVLAQSKPRGAQVQIHLQIMEALGGLGDRKESAQTLRTVLYRGEWWAPNRTATLRKAAAAALRRIGTSAALSILEEAARTGSRGVRTAARAHARLTAARERQHT